MSATAEVPPYISALSQLQVVKDGAPVEPEVPETPETPEVPKTPETPETLEQPTVQQPERKEVQVELKSQSARENFARLEKAKKEVEEKLKAVEPEFELTKKERDELKSKLTEYENKLKEVESQPLQYQEELKKRDEQIQQLAQELRAADITRDPEFTERFVRGRESKLEFLKELTNEDPNLLLRNEDRLMEIRESLRPSEQRRLDALLLDIERLDIEKEETIKNASKYSEQIQQKRMEAFKQRQSQQLQEHLKTRDLVIDNLKKQAPFISDDPELQTQISERLEGLAGGKGAEVWTVENIMGNVAAATLLQKVAATQHAIIEGKDKELQERDSRIVELEKTLKEREEFIKGRYGSLPGAEPAGDGKAPELDSKVPLWQQIRVKV